ncbi:MAG: ATP-binding cassette domain-containing protein [Kordiimonadaceae bacterium]|nr:ATP-binding cassette domain-containing protein [Kordiimonadaceae bacterium]
MATNAYIDANNIEKHYGSGENSIAAVDSVSFQIRMGELTVLMGPSGSGKSTLLSLLGGLETVDSGRLRVGNAILSDFTSLASAKFRRANVGFLFQDAGLLDRMSIMENVALPLAYTGMAKKLRYMQARKSLESLGLGQRMDHVPGQLSGGERQRAGLARAIITKPKLISSIP